MTGIEEDRCFVLRPFDPTLQNVWDLAIRPAVEAAGLEPWDGQEERLGSNIIHHDISRLIWCSRIVVAELTGRNPNVMYELGMAHSAKKPVILLLEKNEVPPFDVTHIRYLEYDRHNLRDLRDNLTARIASVLSMATGEHPDLFPELEVVTPDLREEIDYLRVNARKINVKLLPSCADLFLNNNLVGTGSNEVLINPNSPSNTVSACAIGFFEYHQEIIGDDLERGSVDISLEKVYESGIEISARLSKRVPRWLRDRRRDPQNPVLMRAISSYLLAIGERDDALEEINDLLDVAPTWFMSINQLGFYHGTSSEWGLALPHYQQVATMKPDHFVGHFNLACIYSLLGQPLEALRRLRHIAENDAATRSIRETMDQLSHDPDFKTIVDDNDLLPEFQEIEFVLFPGIGVDDAGRSRGADSAHGYYTF